MANTRLNPSKMFLWASHNIADALEVSCQEAKDDSYHLFLKGNNSFILLKPACDDNKITNQNAGCELLPLTLARVKALQSAGRYENTIYIIPYAESIAKQHWTLLVIQNDSAYFFDPKRSKIPFKSRYDLTDTKRHLTKAFFELKEVVYVDLQSLWNIHHCGYYVGHMISCIVQQIFSESPLLETKMAKVESSALISEFLAVEEASQNHEPLMPIFHEDPEISLEKISFTKKNKATFIGLLIGLVFSAVLFYLIGPYSPLEEMNLSIELLAGISALPIFLGGVSGKVIDSRCRQQNATIEFDEADIIELTSNSHESSYANIPFLTNTIKNTQANYSLPQNQTQISQPTQQKNIGLKINTDFSEENDIKENLLTIHDAPSDKSLTPK